MNNFYSGNVIFRLIRENDAQTVVDNFGRPRKYPKVVSLPAETEALDKDGNLIVIRYAQKQRSIYTHEQSLPEGRQGIRAMIKPQFTDGILAVPKTNKLLIEFLRLHPNNEANQHYGFERQRAIFREHDAEKIARQQNEESMKLSKVTSLVYTSDFFKKVRPVAKYLGISTDKSEELIKYDLEQFAKNNPDDFLDLMGQDFAVVERFNQVCDAEDRGILVMDKNTIKWADGRVIANVPANYESREYMTHISFDKDHRATWNHIVDLMKKQGGSEDDEEELIGSNEGARLEELSIEDLFDVAKDAGQIVWDTPFYKFLDTKVRGGKDKFVEKMKKDKDLVSLIIASLV